MEWTQLISNKRFGQEHKHAERHDDRYNILNFIILNII